MYDPTENVFIKEKLENKKAKFSFLDKLNIKNLVYVVSVVVLAILIAIWFFVKDNPNVVQTSRAINKGLSKTLPFIGGRHNILIIGVDSNNGEFKDAYEKTRSDSLIVINFDPFSKTVNAISIPRDSKVFISERHGLQKINAAHAIGGADLLIKTIEENLGIRIKHYISVNYNAIKELVKALDGVPVNVEKRMRYRDRTAHLNIDLYPGFQVLDAENAEGYLRFRHDALGDLNRMKRQRLFVKSIAEKLKSPAIIKKLPELIKIANDNIQTDMNMYELTKYAAYFKSVDIDSVKTATLPGAPSSHGPISYWVLDTYETQRVIDRLIYRESAYKKNESLTVSILYTSNNTDESNQLKDMLINEGFKINCQKLTSYPQSQILAHSEYASLNKIKKIKKNIPILNNAPFEISPKGYLCGESDYTIVLSGK